MNKTVRRILFKVIAGIILAVGAFLLVFFIPKFSELDEIYSDNYNKCEDRENTTYNQRGHYEYQQVMPDFAGHPGSGMGNKFVSDYEKKDCVEEASKIKNEKESSLQFWVILGSVVIVLGIIILFVSFI